MLLQETILCATAPTPALAGPGLIAIHDVQTGATLASFKQTNAGPHSVAVLESKNSQGGYILASQPEKSILNVYNFQKVGPSLSDLASMTRLIHGPGPNQSKNCAPREADVHSH
jgi:hypothetical protein